MRRPKEYMVELEGDSGNKLHITPYHPVYSKGLLSKGCSQLILVLLFQRNRLYDVYICIKNRHQLLLKTIYLPLMVIKWRELLNMNIGTERVINDLRLFDTYHFGFVNLNKNMFVKENGKVKHICNYKIPNFKTNVIDFLLHSNL